MSEILKMLNLPKLEDIRYTLVEGYKNNLGEAVIVQQNNDYFLIVWNLRTIVVFAQFQENMRMQWLGRLRAIMWLGNMEKIE